MKQKFNKSREKDEIMKELEELEKTRQKAVHERDRLVKKFKKLDKAKIPYDGEGGFFKKGKLISKKQIETIWNRSKETDYRKKIMLLLNPEFRRDKDNIRREITSESPEALKRRELFRQKYDIDPTPFIRIQPLSFYQMGNIGMESKILCKDCGNDLNPIRDLPGVLDDNTKVVCPFCHKEKPFKEGYLKKHKILLSVGKDTKLHDIIDSWQTVEFLKKAILRESFEEKEEELTPNWDRDYRLYKLYEFRGKTYSEIAKIELKGNKNKWQEYVWEKVEKTFKTSKEWKETEEKKIERKQQHFLMMS